MTGPSSKATVTTGLFIGAGASYELGMPLVWDLTKELKIQVTPDRLASRCENWQETSKYPGVNIEKFMTAFNNADMHYESVIGFLEVQRNRSLDPVHSFHGMQTQMIEWVYGILLLRHLSRQNYILLGLRLMEGIIGLAEQNKPLWIFSLNHDLIVECLALQYKTPLSAGLPLCEQLPRYNTAGVRNGMLPIEVCRLDAKKKDLSLKFFDKGEFGINLLKLHGGIDVFTRNDGTEILRFLPLDQSVNGIFQALKVMNEEVIYPLEKNSKVKVLNEIAYADSKGELQLLQRSLVAGVQKYTDQNRQVMPIGYLDVFGSKLKELQSLICIGYSFGDPHINSKMRDWLESSETHNLELVSPAANVHATFAHLTNQIRVHKSNATDYLEQFGAPLNDFERTFREFRQFERESEKKKRGFA